MNDERKNLLQKNSPTMFFVFSRKDVKQLNTDETIQV